MKRLALDKGRLLGRARGVDPWTLAEIGLLSLLAIQCARLAWTLVTPVGPVGDWRPATEAAPATASLGSFDPFFRLSGPAGPVVVTGLNLKLYGVRQDEASGRGSAIISTPDGRQRSFAVGDEIVPGVVLKAVDFDNVTISRGGTDEQLFMDQTPPAQAPSSSVPAVSSPPVTSPAVAPPSVAPPSVMVPPPPVRSERR